MARNGFDPVKEFWRTGQERAPHRKYPSNFGLQGICYDYDLYNVCKVNDDLHCGIKPKRKAKSHRLKSKSIPDFNMPLMDHQCMFYPPPPSKEYFDKYYEYYYGVPPPHSQPSYQSRQKQNAGKFYDSLNNKDFILTDDIAANQNTGQSYGQLDTSNSSSGNSSSGAPLAYYDHSQTFGFKN